jgi:hypothetical protein
MNETLGKWHWLFALGFQVTFDTMHFLGILGMLRSILHLSARSWMAPPESGRLDGRAYSGHRGIDLLLTTSSSLTHGARTRATTPEAPGASPDCTNYVEFARSITTDVSCEIAPFLRLKRLKEWGRLRFSDLSRMLLCICLPNILVRGLFVIAGNSQCLRRGRTAASGFTRPQRHIALLGTRYQ